MRYGFVHTLLMTLRHVEDLLFVERFVLVAVHFLGDEVFDEFVEG